MKEKVAAVEYLCFGCGTQGLAEWQHGEAYGSEGPPPMRCPSCGKRVVTFNFRMPVPESVEVTTA